MSAIDELQAAVSRFGAVAGFGAVVASNTVDEGTVAAVSTTLQWIRANVATEADTATGLLNQLPNADAIAQSASGLATYFNQVATSQNLGGSNLVIPLPGVAPRGIPNWLIYLAVAIVVIGGGTWIIYRKRFGKTRHRALRPAMAGFELGALEHHVVDDYDDDYDED